MQINPIFKREILQRSRTKRIMFLILVMNCIILVFGLSSFYLAVAERKEETVGFTYSNILLIYIIITMIEYIVVLCILPALTGGLISQEQEKQTLDIMLSTGISKGRILRGKLAVAVAMIYLLAISTLPIFTLIQSVGGITIGDIAQFMLLLIISSIYIGSIGLFFSVLAKRTVLAYIGSYTTLLLIIIGSVTVLLGKDFLSQVLNRAQSDTIPTQAIQISVGFLLLILLINPVYTYFAMIYGQIGISLGLFGQLRTTNTFLYYILSNWFVISIIVQLFISGILILFAMLRFKKITRI